MTLQLPLGVSLPVLKRFDSYVVGDNQLLVDILSTLSAKQGEQQVLIWGASGTGKTHLLQAVCDLASQCANTVTYIPLSQFIHMQPDVLSGLENVDIVCIDDCQHAFMRQNWEVALFNLINACRETQARVLFSCQVNPVHARIGLPDLQSRLQWGPVLHLKDLHDEQKCDFLQQRAQAQGLSMDIKTANYILQHYHRDMASLSVLLEQLDKASLAAGRRLSIPFVKTVLQTV